MFSSQDAAAAGWNAGKDVFSSLQLDGTCSIHVGQRWSDNNKKLFRDYKNNWPKMNKSFEQFRKIEILEAVLPAFDALMSYWSNELREEEVARAFASSWRPRNMTWVQNNRLHRHPGGAVDHNNHVEANNAFQKLIQRQRRWAFLLLIHRLQSGLKTALDVPTSGSTSLVI